MKGEVYQIVVAQRTGKFTVATDSQDEGTTFFT